MTKPFGCIDITHDKNNENVNGQEFIQKRVSLSSADDLEKTSGEITDMVNKSRLPLPLRVLEYVSQFVFIVSLSILIGGIVDVGFSQAIKVTPWWLFVVVGASLACWSALVLTQRLRNKKILEGEEAEQIYEETNRSVENINKELGIPEDAIDVDILTFCYKRKDDKIISKARGFAPEYFNSVFSLFVEGNDLCLADLEAKYAFPLCDLRSIKKVNKWIYTAMWNKETGFNEGEYKQYKIRVNNYGWICFKPYYILELERNGTLWGIYLPCYELKAIEELTGLKADTEN